MKLGSNISYQNPINSLNNGIFLALTAKEDKVWFDNWEIYGLVFCFFFSLFLDAGGILMVDYLQKKILHLIEKPRSNINQYFCIYS